MAQVSNVSLISKAFSKLGDNTGSVIPMFAKDTVSNGLISYTYFKDSGKLEGGERALEEFGTGLIWLGGIPFVKKFLFDDFIYKKSGINPKVDAKKLFSSKKSADSIDFALDIAKQSKNKFKEQAKILTDTVNNKTLAKRLSATKFGVSTLATAAMMFGLITLKQKRTEKEVKKEVEKKCAEKYLLQKSLKENPVYKQFDSKEGKDKNVSFTGLSNIATFFMTNPVANTAIVDTVITGTRLKQARKGERGEVGFKEFCQLAFIYGLATPLQKGLELVSDKVFKKPIALDYPVLNSDVIKEAISAHKAGTGEPLILKQAKDIVDMAGFGRKIPNKNAKKVLSYIYENQDSQMVDVLKKSGIVDVFKTKSGKEEVSLLSSIDTKKVRKAAKATIDLIEKSTNKDTAKFLKGIKFMKGAAILANIGISAFLIGYVQPKVNLYLRKKKQDGDNTNPAIHNLEKEIEKQLSFKG